MDVVERDIDRALNLLRNKIRERGMTQLQVQDALDWGRSYISQLLTKQKSLRLEQVLKILQVIEVAPSEFFGEMYYIGPQYPAPPAYYRAPGGNSKSGAVDAESGYHELGSLVRGLLRVLIDGEVIKPEDLKAAVHTSDGDLADLLPGGSETPS